MRSLPQPRTLFRRIAAAEAVTWTLLILGMVFKYVTRTTDLGVRVFGMAHGVVFLAFVLVTLALWVDHRWSARTALLTLASAIPPWATIWAERRLERDGRLRPTWRLAEEAPRSAPERLLAGALRRPLLALALGLFGIALVTAVLLWLGPPVPKS